MELTNLLFIFSFLPFSVCIYYISNDKAKEYVLVALSLFFYAVGDLQYFIIFLCLISLTVIIGRFEYRVDVLWQKRVILLVGILINLCVLGYYKYYDFVIENCNTVFGVSISTRNLILPLGISFYTFKSIAYLVDVYCGKISLEADIIHDYLYLSFFPQLQCGPLSRYSEMSAGIAQSETIKASIVNGIYRFVIGFCKKVLLADILAKIVNEVFTVSVNEYTCGYAWLGAMCYALQIYYDFSGYSDMAIGLTEVFGYHCEENFDYPYMTESVGKFWRRWHISLSQWFRDYVYIPLGGSRTKSKVGIIRNLFVVWILTGLWHGADWKYLIWGLGYFVMILFEKLTGFPERLKSKFACAFYRLFSLIFIICQWVIFRAKDIQSGLGHIMHMFCAKGNALYNVRAVFLIKEYWAIIILAIVFCFPIVPFVEKRLLNRKGFSKNAIEMAYALVICVLFICALSLRIAGQNNPFVYANF